MVGLVPIVFCLFSSLLARILRLRGCSSTVFCGVSFVDDVDEADGLGALDAASVSVLVTALFGLADVWPTLPPAVGFSVALGFVLVTSIVSVVAVVVVVAVLAEDDDDDDEDDAAVVVVVDDEVAAADDETGAGDGELLCSCGDELLEPRSTDWPPRCELRRTRC